MAAARRTLARERHRGGDSRNRPRAAAGSDPVESYGATQVILVGSLCRGEFGDGSDIDLAVSGVSPELFFRAGADLERAAAGVKVDLVPLESANSFFVDAATREGLCLA